MDSIPDTGTSKDTRDLLKSAFIPALPKDSRARQIAEAANDPVNADSLLRGKAEFDRAAAALLLLPDSSEDGTIRFRDADQDQLTPAGMVAAQRSCTWSHTHPTLIGDLGVTVLKRVQQRSAEGDVCLV